MARFTQLLRIKRATNAERDAAVDLEVVSEAGNTAVVDLGLFLFIVNHLIVLFASDWHHSYLCKRERINLVLAGELNADSGAALGIPGGLGTSLHSRVDLLVVRGSKDVQAVGGGDGSVVLRGGVSKCGRVLGDGGLLNIIAHLTTDHESLVAEDKVAVGADLAAGLQVEESTAVEVLLLEVKIELLALVPGGRVEVGQDLALQSVGKGVIQFHLGSEQIGRVPGLGNADTCTSSNQHVDFERGTCTSFTRANPMA